MGKVIIFSAPSGSGKTTIVKQLLERYPQLEFSVSATSRAPRGTERDGVDYYFLSHEAFMQAVAENRFVEWEEVYKGTCYGTLRSEMERIWQKGHIMPSTSTSSAASTSSGSSAATPARSSSCPPRSKNCAAGSRTAAPTPPRSSTAVWPKPNSN